MASCGGGGGSSGQPAVSSSPSNQPSNTPSPPKTIQPAQTTIPNNPQCPRNQIPTHESLGLGCLEQAQFDARVNALATSYRQSMDERKQWQLRALRAEYAYAHLHLLQGADATPGKGITIGFVDSGIDPSSPLVAGVGITERFFGRTTRESARKTTHGTRVVSVAVRRLGEFYGLAYGADVAMLAIPLSDGSGPDFYDPIRFNPDEDNRDSRLFTQALKMDTPILNLSIAYQGIIEDYTEEYLRTHYSKTIAVLAQKGVEDKTVFVLSASNNNDNRCRVADIGARCVRADSQGVGTVDASSPSVWAGLPARIPELRGHWVAVVAIGDGSGGDWRFPSIAGYSNRCGIARDWCIAAPGSIAFPAGGGNSLGVLSVWSGTSFAAPLVSGGLAIMKQLFRDQLSNTELLARLFKTADKSGRYADRDIYGQGLMDLQAATNPWGEAAFMRTGQSIDSQASSVRAVGTGLRPSTTMGDSFVQALAGHEVAAFDDLGAPFWYAADSFVQSPQTDLLTGRMDRLFAKTSTTRLEVGDWNLGLRSGGGVQDFGHLALAHKAHRIDLSLSEDWSVTYVNRSQQAKGSSLSGLTTAWRPPGLGGGVALQAGWLSEPNTLLGSSATGAFGRLSGRTNFVSVEMEAVGPAGWQLSTRGEWGVVRPDNADGLFLRALSTLHTDAYRVAAHRRLANGGTLQVAMEQPVRVVRGTADLELPTGRSVTGHVLGRRMSVGMTPTGRQRDLSARLDYPVANGSLALEGVLSYEPGHRVSASAEWTVLMGWTTRF